MGAIYHKGQPYSGQMVVDTDLSKVSNNPLKNRTITGLVDDVIAPVEGANASQAYSAGDELILNNLLYKANQAITQGTAFNPESGGNIDLAGSIVEQLKALFNGESILKYSGDLTSDCNVSNSDNTFRWYRASSNSANAPSTQYGVLIDISRYSGGGQEIQFYVPILSTVEIYCRIKSSGSWPTTSPYGWKQIYGKDFGTVHITSTLTTIASDTATDLASVTNLEPGSYLFIGRARYLHTNGKSGQCGVGINTTSASMGDGMYVNGLANSSVNTRAEMTKMIHISSTSTIVYLVGFQNSGSTLSLGDSYLQYYKLF